MRLFKRPEPPLDPFERAARRSDPNLATLDEVPELGGLASLRPRNLLLLFFGGVLVVAFLRNGVGAGAPALSKDCTKAAYKLSSDDVRRYGVLKWSATGPADASIVFGLDTATVPEPHSDNLLAGPLPITECLRNGLFGVRTPAGKHQVTVFLVRQDGTSTVVGTSALTVDPE